MALAVTAAYVALWEVSVTANQMLLDVAVIDVHQEHLALAQRVASLVIAAQLEPWTISAISRQVKWVFSVYMQ